MVSARKAAQRGFTLLELIIVIAIIGILATIAMPALKDMPRRANESVLKTNLRTIRDLIDQYYGDQGHYPESLDVLDAIKAQGLRGAAGPSLKPTSLGLGIDEAFGTDNIR